MYTIEQKFRASYTGEDVTTLLKFEDGQQPPQTEWVANSVFNNYVTTQAVVIGGGETALKNNKSLLTKIKNHKGGLLAANKLQTYGTNDTWKYIPCDFLVAISDANVKPIIVTSQDMILGLYYITMENSNKDEKPRLISSNSELEHALHNKSLTLHAKIKYRYKVRNEHNERYYKTSYFTEGKNIAN